MDDLTLESTNLALKPVLDAIYDQYKEIVINKKKLEDRIAEYIELEAKLDKIHTDITGKSLKDFKYAFVLSEKDRNKNHLDDLGSLQYRVDNRGYRFWRSPNFDGWKVFVRKYILAENKLLSLSDLIEMTGETDKLERKAL